MASQPPRGLPQGFQNLDEPAVFHESLGVLNNINTRNFAVEFDNNGAYTAFNLDDGTMGDFLCLDRAKGSCVRWIHIFGPERQKGCILKIAEKYKLSPRLQRIIMTPALPNLLARKSVDAKRGKHSRHSLLREHHGGENTVNGSADQMQDPEKHLRSMLDASYTEKVAPSNHYILVDRVWHFCSTDWSSKSLCVGYNSLSDLTVSVPQESASGSPQEPRDHDSENADTSPSQTRPSKAGEKLNAKRLWNWLLICEDGTVISIQENALPRQTTTPSEQQGKMIRSSRKTLCNVFKHMSFVDEGNKNLAIDTLDIRPNVSSSSSGRITTNDSAGLLFYYLFDDWYTTLELIAGEKTYTTVLDELRSSMSKKAQVSRIEQLHQVGRQLAVLKRMYQSYVMLIDRILDRSGSSNASDAMYPKEEEEAADVQQYRSQERKGRSGEYSDDGSQAFRVPLTSQSAVKFERLRDRIKMLALSEIEEWLAEKESLVFLNFNLITMRQSQAVEKLTRITILLAKVTIMFMPVSLMTGYFSTQIDDLQGIYSATTYWVCFAVTVSLSFFFLLVFGVFSKTVEGRLVYQSLTDISLAFPKRGLGLVKAIHKRRQRQR